MGRSADAAHTQFWLAPMGAAVAVQEYTTVEKGHGRIETRRYRFTRDTHFINGRAEWKGLCGVGTVERTRETKAGVSRESSWFALGGSVLDVQTFAYAVRSHWAIENTLHWRLDVVFNDDRNNTSDRTAAQNLRTLRTIALAALDAEKTSKGSTRIKRKACSWDVDYAARVLAAAFPGNA